MELILLFLAILALTVTFVNPVVGMRFAAGLLFFASLVMLIVAKGAIHEGTAATLIVGSFLCAGLAGIVGELQRLRLPRAPRISSVDPLVLKVMTTQQPVSSTVDPLARQPAGPRPTPTEEMRFPDIKPIDGKM